MNEYVSLKFQKNAGRTGGKLKPQDTESTRLQELSLMSNTYFSAIHYDIHLDMKLDYTISRIFHEMSLSELETLHQLCELERTQILQSLALAVLKIIHNIENKLTRFQIYPETELACKYNKPLYKTQYSEILVEYDNGFDMITGKLIIHQMATSHSYTDDNSLIY